jgi:hypothetical protein
MKARSFPQPERRSDFARLLHRRALALTALILAVGTAAHAEDAKPEAKEEPEPLTPEEMFEGGKETYANWIDLSVGGLFTDGNNAQAQQRMQYKEGAFGGIEDFHYSAKAGKKSTLTLDGRAIFDNEDYKFGLALENEKVGFFRFKAENFRTWSNGDGGYYHPGNVWFPADDNELALDRGEISFEAGLTLKDIPKLTFRYTHGYRDGDKASTIWGTRDPSGTGSLVGLAPAFYDLDEERDIFELEATHQIKKTLVGLDLRYETGDLNNALKTSLYQGGAEPKITDRQETEYDLFSANAFTETWLKKNVFFSSGFSFTDLDSTFTGNRIYGTDYDVAFAANAFNGLGYTNLIGIADQKEYVLNLNLMTIPLRSLTVTPSIRVQRTDWDSGSTAGQTTPGALISDSADGDYLDIRERLDIRYTGVTNWAYYARGEWTQGEGNSTENGGLTSPVAAINRTTEDSRNFQKYSAGAKWYATRKTSVDVGGYYKLNSYDYDHDVDSTGNAGGNRYPAYLVMQDFETVDGNIRLTLRPRSNLSLVSRYEYQISDIETQPDPASGLGSLQSSEMTSHIFGQNASWSPWMRLGLQLGFNYVASETVTPASDLTQAILDAQNNYWSVNLTANVILDDKSDLSLGYNYYRADNFDDNSAVGVPYGAGAEEHSASATVTRRLTEHLRVSLSYGYVTYTDETSGGNNDFDAHFLSTRLQYRF